MGFLRLYLAICVAHFHGIAFPFEQLLVFDGRQAVQLFYVLSGFYITMVLCETYDKAGGTRVFYLKRALRIFPLYWFSIIVVGVLALATGHVVAFHMDMPVADFWAAFSGNLWSCVLVVVSNLGIIGSDLLWLVGLGDQGIFIAPFTLSDLHNGSSFSLNAPAFTLAIELYFYLIAPFVVKNVRRVWLFLGVGFVYQIGLMAFGYWNVISYYHLIPASYLYFAMGALAFHMMRGRIPVGHLVLAGVAALIVFSIGFQMMDEALKDIGFFVVWGLVALSVLWVPFLFGLTKQSRGDHFLGDMSYTVYVLHYPLLSYAGEIFMSTQAYVWLLVFSVVVTLFVERPLETIRRRITV